MRTRPPLKDTDMYAVERQIEHGRTVFRVRHFPSRTATEACCDTTVEQGPGESDTETLRAAHQAIDRYHGGTA